MPTGKLSHLGTFNIRRFIAADFDDYFSNENLRSISCKQIIVFI